MEGDQDQMEGGEIEGVTGDRTFWLASPRNVEPRTLFSSSEVRASDEIGLRLRMKYERPSSTIVMLSVEVRKVVGRTELYIVPETTSALLLLGEVG